MIPSTPNPWGLTKREGEALSALIEHGSSKASGTALGVTDKTIEALVTVAKRRMNLATRVQAVVLWDRWLRDSDCADDVQRLNLVNTVADLVARGIATNPDAMLPHCAGYSRQQVMVAVRNAVQKGRIHLVGRISNPSTPGQRLGVYAAGQRPQPGSVFTVPDGAWPVSSVFQMGERAGATA